jgi:coenzyme F420-reducing hydrogenase delta subunit
MKLPERKDAGNILFHCRRQNPNDFPAFRSVIFDGESAVEIELPCSGRIGTGELMQGIAAGYRRVVVLSCGEKSCVHKFGCMEAKKAFNKAKTLAETAGIDTKRFTFIEADDPELELK